ncbi:hypothetical protein BKA63DRAFT_503896, partial [Paraphoma chrysanthemicola]
MLMDFAYLRNQPIARSRINRWTDYNQHEQIRSDMTTLPPSTHGSCLYARRPACDNFTVCRCSQPFVHFLILVGKQPNPPSSPKPCQSFLLPSAFSDSAYPVPSLPCTVVTPSCIHTRRIRASNPASQHTPNTTLMHTNPPTLCAYFAKSRSDRKHLSRHYNMPAQTQSATSSMRLGSCGVLVCGMYVRPSRVAYPCSCVHALRGLAGQIFETSCADAV